MINGGFSYSLGTANAWVTRIQHCQYSEHPRSLYSVPQWYLCRSSLGSFVMLSKKLGEKILVATKPAASLTQLQQLHSDSLSDTSASTRHYCNLMFEQGRFENTGRRHACSCVPLGLSRWDCNARAHSPQALLGPAQSGRVLQLPLP